MGSRTRVKVCGMTRLEDALGAVDAGVDALGFIFATQSPRCVTMEACRRIVKALPPFVNSVGVFLDQDQEEVRRIVDHCGLNWVQLHGRETPDYCRQWHRSGSPARLIKAFRVSPDTSAADFLAFEKHVDAFLLDTYVRGQEGGTGLAFDWSRIDGFGLQRPLILAGGLTADNAVAAVTAVHPYALDVNSGVETAAGIKDVEQIRLLMARVSSNRQVTQI